MKGITIYDHAATGFSKIRVEQLGDNFAFTEGPAWHPDGFLIFSDIPANKIYKLGKEGSFSVYLEPSGFSEGDRSLLHEQIGSNGLTFDQEGNLLICQHGNHRVAGQTRDGRIFKIATAFEGKPFNSPNDIAVAPNGDIFFSDPPYGLKDQVLNTDKFQSAGWVYRVRGNDVQPVCKELNYPNGLVFSPDGQYLYISTNHEDEPTLLRYTMDETGMPGEKIIFLTQNADGLGMDSAGNLYMATDEGILVADQHGQKLVLIPLDETPTNMAWEGSEHKKLYVTARSKLFAIHFG